MAHTYKSEGIILKRWAYKERDKMVRVLTRDFGKVTARAISSRAIKSKLAGHLEPFVLADFFFAKSKTIDIVAGSSTLESFEVLRTSLPHTAAANYFCEVVDRFTQDREADVVLFEAVFDALQRLSVAPVVNVLILYGQLMQILEHLGYHFELERCHSCKRVVAADETIKLHYQLWAVECAECRSVEDVAKVSAETIKVLRFILQAAPQDTARLQVGADTWKDVDTVFRALLRYHVDGVIQSEAVFLELLAK